MDLPLDRWMYFCNLMVSSWIRDPGKQTGQWHSSPFFPEEHQGSSLLNTASKVGVQYDVL